MGYQLCGSTAKKRRGKKEPRRTEKECKRHINGFGYFENSFLNVEQLPNLINGPQVADEHHVQDINDGEAWRQQESSRRQQCHCQQRQHIRAAAKRRVIEKRRTVHDKGINRILRSIGVFTASRLCRALKESESLGKILQEHKKAVQDLKKMQEARDAFFQSASQQHEFIPVASRASWKENTAHISSALQHAEDFTKNLKKEIRIKRVNIQTIQKTLGRENTGEGNNTFRQLSGPSVPIFDILQQPQQRQRSKVIHTAAAKRQEVGKMHNVIDNRINRKLRAMGKFASGRLCRALRELESLRRLLQKQEKSIQKLKMKKEARDALFQSASQQHEFISIASKTSWGKNTAHIASALRHAKNFSKDLKKEIRIKEANIQTIREGLGRESTGGLNKFRQLPGQSVPIFDTTCF